MATRRNIAARIDEILEQADQFQDGNLSLDKYVDLTSTTVQNNIGQSILAGTPLYPSGSGEVSLAKADSLSTARVLWIAKEVIQNGTTGQALLSGSLTLTTSQWDNVTGQSGGLTPGSNYYLSAVEAGKLSTSIPTESGEVVAKLGVAHSSTLFIFDLEKLIVL